MSDEVVVNVDSLVAAGPAAFGAGNGAVAALPPPLPEPESMVTKIKILVKSPGAGSSGTKNDSLVTCKICHDEGLESELENPCGCDGTIKFAHRNCVQKWCDIKGNIICEICHQEYHPNYTAPANNDPNPRSNLESRLNNPLFLALAAAENDFPPSDSEDDESDSRVSCCKSAGSIVMVLLFLRHLLMIVVDTGLVQDSSAAYYHMFAEFVGFLLPAYVVVRSLYLIRWHQLRWVWSRCKWCNVPGVKQGRQEVCVQI